MGDPEDPGDPADLKGFGGRLEGFDGSEGLMKGPEDLGPDDLKVPQPGAS